MKQAGEPEADTVLKTAFNSTPGTLNPNIGITEEEKLQRMEDGDYAFAHNDGNEVLLSKKGLGMINWASPWSLANMLRYAHAANTVVHVAGSLKTRELKVLDVGCSSGTFVAFWKHGYSAPSKPKLEYIGLEVDADRVRRAIEVCAPARETTRKWAKVVQHDLVTSRLTDNLPAGWVPQVIIAQEIIEHIGEKAALRFLKEAFDLLPSGGTLFISTPAPRKEEGENWVWPESHAYEFSTAELTELVTKVGFKVTHVAGWFSQGKSRKGITPEAKSLYKRLSVASPAVAAMVIGFLHPEFATCITLTLEKP